MFLKLRADVDDGDRSSGSDFWYSPVPMRSGLLTVTPDTALRLVAVYACVRILAEGVASLGFHLSRVGANGRRTPLRDHWLYRLFARRPNDAQNPFEFREQLQGHLALRGNAYCKKLFAPGDVVVRALLPLHPDSVAIELVPSIGSYRYKVISSDGSVEYLSREEVFHIRALTVDGVLGVNPIQAARESLSVGIAAQQYGARFFGNNARPGGWIESPSYFKTVEDRGKFREAWQRAQTGMNQGKTAVLEGGMKFHETELTNDDAQFLETRKFQTTEIARLFRIPPHMIADLDRATFSNIEQMSLEFVTYTLTPWLVRWEEAIKWNFLDPEDDADIDIEFPTTDLLRGDATARSNYYASGITNGWLTRNEARASERLDPLDGLDEPLVPLNMGDTTKQPGGKDEKKPGAPTPRQRPGGATSGESE